MRPLSLLLALTFCATAAELTIEIEDYATMPMTGGVDATGNAGQLARVNFFRQEPGGGPRVFVNDLNGPLYILDRKAKKLTTYLDFNGRKGGLFRRLPTDAGLANGFISFQFDPDYRKNGKFYTVHLEDPSLPGSAQPDNTKLPGLKLGDYKVTAAIRTPGAIQREAVVIEWTDANTHNATFEGTARELMRVQYNTRIHPMGDLIFNPTARKGDSDWRVLYIGAGDGGSGEQLNDMRMNPQRLDALVGKILRIIPDPKEHVATSTVSENGRYRIPNDNPFVSVEGARKEIWALGLRNPHRLSWDVDPANHANNHLIANVVGLRTWETVVLVRKGANYGYSLREGNQQMNANNTMRPLPEVDKIPLRIDESKTAGDVTPAYPVALYGHVKEGGDAVGSGFVYRGKKFPALRGKYIFCDITSGRLWYLDYKEMLAADDGNPATMAAMHPVSVALRGTESEHWGKQTYDSMFPIVEAAYHARGGKAQHLPGAARVSGNRADVRFSVDADGELYILSKSDGMIRVVTGAESN